MKKIIFIAMLLIPMMGFAKISVTKQGDYMKISGLSTTETTLTNADGILYLTNISAVVVNGRNIQLFQCDRVVVTFNFSRLDTKYGKNTARAWIEYLIANQYM